jgi:hypothetical protein
MERNFRNRTNSNNRSQQSQQPMMSGFMDSAKERPFVAAAAVGGAVAAGAFLWSRRNQISDQLSSFSGQDSDRPERMGSQRDRSSFMQPGRSSIPTGTESPGQPEMAGAGTTSPASATRATGGLGGKAQGGQNLNPSRTANQGTEF